MGFGQDPNTGEHLGRPYRKFASAADRVQRRLEPLPEGLTASEIASQVALIEAEEAGKPTGAPVAGFDLTFSVPKSVSTLWAAVDGGTQTLITRAHHAAIRDVLALLERDVAMTVWVRKLEFTRSLQQQFFDLLIWRQESESFAGAVVHLPLDLVEVFLAVQAEVGPRTPCGMIRNTDLHGVEKLQHSAGRDHSPTQH